MSNEKIVVVLLIVTIVLSIFSVILVATSGGKNIDSVKIPTRTVTDKPISNGQVIFGIDNPTTGGGTQ